MIFRRYGPKLIIGVTLLFVTLLVSCWLIVMHRYGYLALTILLAVYQVSTLINMQLRLHKEVSQFVEAIYYRDFSRHFNPSHAPAELRALRDGFNNVISTFKQISNERETQYHYLEKVLELVDTGIMFYNQQTGEVEWVNEAFKRLTGIPYLKTLQSLKKRNEHLYSELNKLQAGNSKTFSMGMQNQQVTILMNASTMKKDHQLYKLIAFQNVSEAMAETESKAWQRLLNVMTHEIMNSVAPISSLADTLMHRLKSPDITSSLPATELDDLELGINTIKGRSEGLLKFTESYRSLNKITHLDLKKILVRDLFETLHSLMAPTLEKKDIELEIILRDPAISIEADQALMEQLFINLIINAVEAVKDSDLPVISLSAETVDSKVILKVQDNGYGIPSELLDQVFIPFFSTRKSGSGIGLSLCKQIMLLHKGSIQIQSAPGKGATFILAFQQVVPKLAEVMP